MLVIIAANAIFLPVAITFYADGINVGWILFNMLSDLLYLVDIIFSFWTGAIAEDNVIILELSKLRKIYMKKWFLLDITSVFPFDYIALVMTVVMPTDISLQVTNAIRILTLLRLLKLVKFLRYIVKWQEVCMHKTHYIHV